MTFKVVNVVVGLVRVNVVLHRVDCSVALLRVRQTHLVDLRFEGVPLKSRLPQLGLEVALFLMHALLVLERLFVEDLVVLLLSNESIGVATVIGDLLQHVVLLVRGSDKLVRDFYFVQAALVDQFNVLRISNHSLLACFKALPLFVFNHSGVGVHVLPLKLNLFQFFGKTSVFFGLESLFSRNLFVSLLQTLFTSLLLRLL